MFRAAKCREVLLKLGHVRTEAERTLVDRPRDGGVELRADRADLGGEVEVRNFGVHSFAVETSGAPPVRNPKFWRAVGNRGVNTPEHAGV